jgi:SagB-type dehydrogenase family enzyme
MAVTATRRRVLNRALATAMLIVACLILTCLAFVPAAAQESDMIPLPAARRDGGASIERVLAERRSVRQYRDEQLSLEAAAQLLWAAQGVTRADGSRRTAPSAGALYPLEAYLVAGSVQGLEPGVYRYVAGRHALVRVHGGDVRAALADAALAQRSITEAPASIVLTGVHARTRERYGDRTTRYVDMEVGAAAQNVALQAVSLGLGCVYVGAFRDATMTQVLRLPADHAPLAILPVGRAGG